jgi:DEAD/DEAH box helicase domain-containing protein
LLRINLDSFVPREFINYHAGDAVPAVLQILGQVRNAENPFVNMKTQDLLSVMQASWNQVFSKALAGIEPGMIREVNSAHEAWASRQPFSDDAAYQALNVVQGLLTAMESPSATELEMLKRECLEAATDSDLLESADGPVVGDAANLPESSGPPAAPALVETPEPVAGIDPYLDELIKGLRESGALLEQDKITRETRDGVEPVYADGSIFQELTPALAQALADLGIDRLYERQAAAIEKSLSGSDVVADVALDAPAASGESLSFTIPMVESLLRNPGSHALLLCPMQAVANDKLAQLNNLLSQMGLNAERYDGDTSAEERRRIKGNPPSVLITSPEMLNMSLLGRSGDWADFLKNLRFVAMDDIHEYRGYFGANVAVLLRRFAHQLELIGAAPQYFLAADACANPAEHAGNLTGRSFEPVSASGQIRPKRHYLFVDPEVSGSQFYADFQGRISKAASACVALDKSVIIFCPTPKFAEQCYEATRKAFDDTGLDQDCLALVRGGPNDTTGEPVREGMPGGTKKVIFSSDPIAMGVDAGGTDGVILAGFPDTVQAAWQRIGPAGRGRDQDAFVLCYAMNDPMNRFYAGNLLAFLDHQADEIVAYPNNAEIIRAHLPSLIREAGDRVYSFSADVLGAAIFREFPGSRSARRPTQFPQAKVNLRGIEGQVWSLRCDNEPIGEMSAYQKFREAYTRAIYLRSGIKYRVDRVEQARPGESNSQPKIHLLESADLANLRTDPTFVRDVQIGEEYSSSKWEDGISANWGSVMLREDLTEVNVIEGNGSDGDRVVETYTPENDATWELTSQSFWIDVAGIISSGSEHLPEGAGPPGELDGEALAAVEQMLRVGTLFSLPVDSHDTTTHSDGSKIFLIESYPGGTGIVKKVFDRWRNILETGMEIAVDCQCSGINSGNNGCPNCLIPPHSYAQSLDKAKGLELAQRLLEATADAPLESAESELSN